MPTADLISADEVVEGVLDTHIGSTDYTILKVKAKEAAPDPAPPPSASSIGSISERQRLEDSPDELSQVGRFAILISSSTHGAFVREAAPPKQ